MSDDVTTPAMADVPTHNERLQAAISAAEGAQSPAEGEHAGEAPESPSEPQGAPADPSKPQGEDQAADAPEGEAPEGEPEGADDAETKRLRRIYADLAKRDREMREREKALKDLEGETGKYKDIAKRFRDEPAKLVAELAKDSGLSFQDAYNKLTEHVLGQGEGQAGDSSDPMQRRLEALEKRLAEKEEQEKQRAQEEQERQQQAEMQAAVKEFQTGLEGHITEHADDYPVLNALGRQDLAMQAAIQYAESTGQEPDKAACAAQAEEALKAEAEALIPKLLEIPGLREAAQAALGKAQGETPEQPPEDNSKPQAAGKKTLTNDDAASVPPREGGEPLSDQERFNRALRRLT